MANAHGNFIWYELMTSDVDAAARFYGAVLGWQARPAGGSTPGYHLFGISGVDVAGLMAIPPNAAAAGMRPAWLGYIGVDDIDATVGEIAAAGGATHLPPTDIPGVGRLAMVTDPQGAPFYVMRGTMEGMSTSFSPTQTGHCHWNELTTNDQAAALAFYGDRFGWQKGEALPMGEMGVYQLVTHHGEALGAVMSRRPNMPPPSWTFYFGIDDIDIAAEAVTAAGGAVHHGPAEVPGDAFIIVASDPQGARLGLVGPRRR